MGYEQIPVGHELPGLRISVTREMIAEFAAASLDHNPLHWDEDYVTGSEFAGERRFTGVIAHGLMTYSFMTRVMTDWLLPDLGMHRRLETRFSRPIYPGDEIQVRGEVSGKHATVKGKWVEVALTATNQSGEAVASGAALAEILA